MSGLLDRRIFMAGALGFGAVAALASCSKDTGGKATGAGDGDAGTVTLVALGEYTGIYAEGGSETRRGVDLIKDEYKGKVGKYKLNFVEGETNAQTDEAVRLTRQSLAAGQTLFMGTQLSNIALAISNEVNKGSGVFTTLAGAPEVTGADCRSSTFRWSNATYTAGHQVVGTVMKAEPKLKKWFCITPDYVFGEALLTDTTAAVEENGGEVIGNAYHGTQETEFSSYLNNASASGADVLAILNVGAQAISTVKQAVSFGLKKKMRIVIVWGVGLPQYKAIGADSMEGIYAGAQYWHTVDTPNNKKFVAAYQKKYKENPTYVVASAYYCCKAMLDGVTSSGSNKSAGIVDAMVSEPFQGVTGKEVFRPEDHQLIKDFYVLLGKPASERKDADDIMKIMRSDSEAAPVKDVGCTLVPLGK